MKKFILGFIVGAIMFGSVGVYAATNSKMIEVLYSINDIVINGESSMPTDENLKPFVYQGTTFVPLRYIGENLDQELNWDGSTKTIYIKGNQEIKEDSSNLVEEEAVPEDNTQEGTQENNQEEMTEEEQSEEQKNTTEKDEEITAVVYENLAAFVEEDIDRFMATLHEDTAQYEDTKQALEQLFEVYDLEATIENVTIIEQSENEAKVQLTQTTIKVSGPQFQDNKIDSVISLKKVDGEWKIYSTVINNIEYL